MPAPDHPSYSYHDLLTSPSRRNNNNNNQDHPHSPFRRARRGTRVSDHIDLPRKPSPSYKTVQSARGNINQARTLRGALEATYGREEEEEYEDEEDEEEEEEESGRARLPLPASPSPGRRRRLLSNNRRRVGGEDRNKYSLEGMMSTRPGLRSPVPPADLDEIYGQIDEEGSLVEDADNEDLGEPVDEDDDDDGFLSNSPGYSGDYAGLSRRRGLLGDLRSDEQRLRNVTAKGAPVFSRGKGGLGSALTVERLRRHNQSRGLVNGDNGNDGDDNDGFGPANWGSHAGNHSWSRRNGVETVRDEDAGGNPGKGVERRIDSILQRRRQQEEREHEQREELERNYFEDDTASGAEDNLGRDVPVLQPSSTRQQEPARTDPVSDTPATIYKNSTFRKPSPRKRDSQDLLSRLKRLESPGHMRTPEPPQKPPESRIYDKTPIVSGAYINTPVTERAPRPSDNPLTEPVKPNEPNESQQQTDSQVKPYNSTRERTKPPLKKPRHPSSALESIIEESKSGNLSDPLGDSTIESLEKFKHSIEEKAGKQENKSDDDDSDAYQRAVEEGLAREAREKEEHKPDAELEELRTQRQALSDKITHIHKSPEDKEEEKKRNLPDKKVEPSPAEPAEPKKQQEEQKEPKPKKEPEEEPKVLPPPKNPRSNHPCQTCTTNTNNNTKPSKCPQCGASPDGRIYASIPLPLLWRREHHQDSTRTGHRTRPTTLGYLTLLTIAWFLTESTLCDYYCHPLVAEVCTGNCLLPNAPRFPFVLPTMLWRWLRGEAILGPLVTVSVAVMRLLLQVWGGWDGFVDDEGGGGGGGIGSLWDGVGRLGTAAIAATATATAAGSVGTGTGFFGTGTGVPEVSMRSDSRVRADDPIVKVEDDSSSMEDDEYVYVG